MTNPIAPSCALLRALLSVFALLTFDAAHAVADVTYTGTVTAKNWDPFNPLEQSFTGTTPIPAGYTAQVGGNNARSITDEVNGGSVYGLANSVVVPSTLGFGISGAAAADTKLSYRVQLIGPDTPFVVPVRVIANGYIGSIGNAYGLLTFVVNYDRGGTSAQLADSRAVYNTGSDVFSFDQVANFKVNAYFDVYLSVTASAGGVGAASDGWSQAFLDPVFMIADPVYASLYHFEGIPGITPSVPEPASWAMAMLGLGVVCGMRRRGRATS